MATRIEKYLNNDDCNLKAIGGYRKLIGWLLWADEAATTVKEPVDLDDWDE